MNEREPFRVQRLARKAQGARALAVGGIADERMSQRREVHADLVRAPGLEAASQEGGKGETLDDLVMRHRLASARHHGHARAAARVPADPRRYRAVTRHPPVHEREVLALHGACGDLAREIGLRRERARDHQEPARVLVEPVHDAGARNGCEDGLVREQRVQQGPAPVAGAGMHDETRRLVDHDERAVLVDDRERYAFGPVRLVPGVGRGRERDALPAMEALARRRRAGRRPSRAPRAPSARAGCASTPGTCGSRPDPTAGPRRRRER